MRFWYFEEQGNFHTITPGEAYRSAQMDRDELEEYSKKFGIRSLINLRGAHPGTRWYEEELATVRDCGILHFDCPGFEPDQPITFGQIDDLIAIFRSAPRPVLIHCQGGADRSGLAAAIWKIAIDGASVQEAKKQMSIFYGHLPVGPTQILDDVLDSWARSRGKPHA